MPTKTKPKAEEKVDDDARKLVDAHAAPEDGLGGVQVTQAAVDPSLAEDHNPKRRGRPDTIPEVQARVLSVIDLSLAFGFDVGRLKAGVIAAVNEEHTESDANCWCGKLHPKKRKAKEGDDGD